MYNSVWLELLEERNIKPARTHQKPKSLTTNIFFRWSNLFLAYSEGNVNAGRAEYQYCRNNMGPYIWFFLGLLVHLLLYPVLRQTIPLSELSVLASGLTFLTVYNFTVSLIYQLCFFFTISVLLIKQVPKWNSRGQNLNIFYLFLCKVLWFFHWDI